MSFWNDLYNNTIGKAVSTAENLWKAGTMPTTGNIIQAGQQAGQAFTKLQTPSTHAAGEQQIAKAKAEAPKIAAQEQAKHTQQLKDIWTAGTTPTTSTTLWGSTGEAIKSYQKLQSPVTRQTELNRIQAENAKVQAAQKQAFETASPFQKWGQEVGAEFGTGLFGKEKPAYMTTGNKFADITAALIGQGLGFVLGGEAFGAARGGEYALQGVEKLLPRLATTEGKTLIPRIATNIARGAVKNGVEMEMLSGIHSVLNADTAQQAQQRAKDYGLMALVGSGIGAGSTELLGAIAKRLKNITPSKAPIEPLKGYTEPPITEMPPVTKEVADSAHVIAKTQNEAGVLHQAGNILKNIVDNSEKYGKEEVMQAKMSLIDLHDKIENLNRSLGFNTEIAGEPRPGIPTPQSNTPPVTPELQTPEIMDVVPSGEKSSFMNALDKRYAQVVDENQVLNKLSSITGGKEAELAANLKSSGGTIDYIFKEKLVDKSGNEIGGSLKSVMDKVPKGQEKEFWNYIIRRGQGDLSLETPEFKNIGDQITDWLNKFGQAWGQKGKAIISELGQKNFGGDKYINPIEVIMKAVDQQVKDVKYNAVLQELAKSVEGLPEKLKDFIEVVPDKEIDPANTISVLMDGGRQVNLKIKDIDIYTRLKNMLVVVTKPTWLKAIQKITNVFKSLITQKNPLFALRNVLRDLPTAYINGSEHNPAVFLKDWAKGIKDVVTKSENYRLAKQAGLGGGGLFSKGEPSLSVEKLMTPHKVLDSSLLKTAKNVVTFPFKLAGEGIEWVNSALETAPRQAEFNRVFKKTGDIDKALFAANDVTVNFSRTGSATKGIDTVLPYFNAGIQGLDKFAKSVDFIHNPGKAALTLAKAGLIITAPKYVSWLLNRNNPNYKNLDNTTKDNYLIFANPFGAKDKDGNPETFIKIPEAREVNILFGALFERIVSGRGMKGFYSNAAGQLFPANPLTSNIAAPLMGAAVNKDMFFGNDIVPSSMTMKDTPAYLQYDHNTSQLLQDIPKFLHDKYGIGSAKVAGIELMSPKILDYLIRSYAGQLGQIALDLMGKGKPGESAFTAIKSSYVSDIAKNNQQVSDFYDNSTKLTSTMTEAKLTGADEKTVQEYTVHNNAMGDAVNAISALNKLAAALDSNKDAAKIRDYKDEINQIAEQYNEWVKAGSKGFPPRLPLNAGGDKQTTKTVPVAQFADNATQSHTDYKNNKTDLHAHDTSYYFTYANKAITVLNEKLKKLEPSDKSIPKIQERINEIADGYNKWFESGAKGTPPPVPESDKTVPPKMKSTSKLKSPQKASGGSSGGGSSKSTAGTHKASTGSTGGTGGVKGSTGGLSPVHVSKISAPKTATVPKLTAPKIKVPKISLPKGVKKLKSPKIKIPK